MTDNGQPVDLFKLYWLVRERGGYDSVSKNNLWGQLAEELGSGPEVGSSLKLIYLNYMYELDQWLQRIFNEKHVDSSFDMEITNDRDFQELCLEKNVEVPLLVNGDSNSTESVTESAEKSCIVIDVDECDNANEDEVVDLNLNVVEDVRDPSLLKRQLEGDYLFGMLDWIKRIAKSPGDSITGEMREGLQGKVIGVEGQWAQALVARETLFLKRHGHLNEKGSRLQKKQKICLSMYEDDTYDNRDRHRLRSSERLLSLRERSLLGSCSATLTIADDAKCPIPSSESLDSNSDSDECHNDVPVGPLFQADVPDWTGVSHGSNVSGDSKWLGKRNWPLKLEHELPMNRNLIGKGRPDSCCCRFPGSMQCIKFHVVEKRFRLKLELGSSFYDWRFDCMGEEVALSWTEEEERLFESIVKLNPPSLNGCFWGHIYRSFPSKSRQSLVSYYFNVFLLRRRSFQNRVTPNNISSDDEELGFGSMS